VQLGYSPRVTIRHTSSTEMGQIYVPEVNWLLGIACVLLVLGFQSSSNLASAYGIKTDLIAGPATDNRVGERFVATLGLPARNARADADALGKFVLDLLEPKLAAKA